MQRVKFRQMAEGDREDYIFLEAHERSSAAAVGDRLLDALSELDTSQSAYQVTRYEHSVQSATRAWLDGADLDWVVAALLHDVGDLYAPYNHDEYAAAILRPYLREQCTWVVAHHGLFQRYYYAHHFGGDRDVRRRHKDNPYFEDAVQFCERWDQASFDPNYHSLPLDHFRPMVAEIFAREPYQPQVIASGVRKPLADPLTAEARAAEGAPV
ncbi:HD domain-containing protein [Acuticoccus sp. MNP-M23]|uniref:HD domain-containing protein n=1 Tax=Acuticoccus sp. MNP-M23 TaxID=3072793 RepID=UPI0028154475|nr:HD domain-containing protein [Acuticoccus sp. MNP-M23]WMS43245.1 HD domain-containing protein [Acuticoccus sp. MNP-M23]